MVHRLRWYSKVVSQNLMLLLYVSQGHISAFIFRAIICFLCVFFVCACVCVCRRVSRIRVCEREQEKEAESEKVSATRSICFHLHVSVCAT